MTSTIQSDSFVRQITNWIEFHPRTVATIFAILFAVQITPEFKMSPDGVSYMSIARSLAQHGKLERLGSPHLRYAPGYPIFITPAFLLFRDHPFLLVQILQWLYALALIWGVYQWFKNYAGASAIWIAALTMAIAGYWDLYRTASSEIVSTPALVWAGVFMVRSIRNPSSLPLLAAAILFTTISCATRQVGVMLVPGYVIALLLRARAKEISLNRAAILAIVFTLIIGLVSYALIAYDHWGARQREAAGDTGYTSVFFSPDRPLAGQIAEGLRRQSGEIGRLLIPGMFKSHGHEHDFTNVNVWIYAAICIPVAIGWWRFARITFDPLALMLPPYIALCVVYPYDSGTRFTVPVFAILVASVWYLFKPTDRPAIFMALVVLHLIVSIIFWPIDAFHTHERYKAWPEIEQVAARVPPDAKVFAFRGEVDDRWMFLMWFTDRPVAYETTADPVASFVDCIVTSNSEPDSLGFQTSETVGLYKIESKTSNK
jgi:hypothetical protein